MGRNSNIGRVLEDKYELIRVIGKGGMGTVYEATHLLIKRRLALKLLHAEYAQESHFAERFKREAQTASAIGHEHIVEITDMGCTDQGELFIVMEYLEGQDLGSLLNEIPRFPPERACHIMVQTLSALEAAHAKGIVHRDLKPANIFLTEHGNTADYVKLVDFGISKIRQEDTDMSCHLTKTGELLGTPSFMSPEQARGDLDINAKSDIFSTGVILYKLLTGVLPFEDKVLTMLLMKILNDNPPHPCELTPEIPMPLGDAVMKSIRKTPSDRFEDAASFRRILQCYSPQTAALCGLKVTQYRDTSEPMLLDQNRRSATPFQLELSDTRPPRKRGRQIALLLTLLTTLAISGTAIFSTIKNRLSPEPAAIISVVSMPQQSIQESPQSPKTIAPPPLLHTISIEISVIPDTAAVQIDGRAIGTGSVEYNAPADGKLHDITVMATGFEPHQAQIRFNGSKQVPIQLTPHEKTDRNTKHKKESEIIAAKASLTPVVNDATIPKTASPQKKSSPTTIPKDETADSPPSDLTGWKEGLKEENDTRPPRVIDEVNPW